jgi:5-methylcytosine-specific restriction endonuclease McrA
MSPLLRVCGCGALVEHPPCPDCKLRTRKPDRSWGERQRRKRTVAAWVRRNGWVCPGWGERDAHPSRDLTADHITPRAHGGEHGPLRVLCRSCNSSRGARP